jgi:regulator of replication initiation timing
MEADLKVLEATLERFITQSERLKLENHQLRQALAQAEDNGRQLKDNVLLASSRLQSIMQKLPQEVTQETSGEAL